MEDRKLNSILKVNDLYAAYIKKEVLNGVSIEVKEKEIVALIGPNGAGKSTLLKVITGFLKPKRGNVIFFDRDITRMEIYERIRMGIGYFMQGGEVFKNMTVEENLEMGFIRGEKADNIREKIEYGRLIIEGREKQKGRRQEMENGRWKMDEGGAKIENGGITIEGIYRLFPNLKKKRKTQANLLSGGERQALALGMILMTQPKLLLLDEPSAGLAPGLVKETLNKIVTINKDMQIPMLIVEQNVREILNIAHRVYLMKAGKIFMAGKSEELLIGNILEDVFLR